MTEINTVVLENGIEYTEVDDIMYNNVRYVLLSNISNVKDSCIRKIILLDNEEYISKLDSDLEFDTVLSLFLKKNKALFN